jgi:hypothetical protein
MIAGGAVTDLAGVGVQRLPEVQRREREFYGAQNIARVVRPMTFHFWAGARNLELRFRGVKDGTERSESART